MRTRNVHSQRSYVFYQIGRLLRSKRGYYGLSVNAASSLGNFAVSLSLARQLTISELGIFATAYALYALSSGLMRAAILEPTLAILDATKATTRVSLLGFLISGVLLGIGSITFSPYFFVLALTIHGLLAYDYLRTDDLARGSSKRALIYESCWFVASASTSLAVMTQAITGWAGFACWAGSGAVLGYVYAFDQRSSLRPRWRINRGTKFKTSCAFGVDFLVGSGSAQFTTSLLAIAVGPAIVGGIRAAATLLGPIGLVIGTARTLMIPLLAKENRTQPARSILLATLLTTLLVLLVLPILAIMALLPSSAGAAILGTNWHYAAPLMPLLSFEALFLVITIAPFAGLRSLLAARRTLITRICLAILRVTGVIISGLLAGAVGACIAIAGIAVVSAVAWWTGYVRASTIEILSASTIAERTVDHPGRLPLGSIRNDKQ